MNSDTKLSQQQDSYIKYRQKHLPICSSRTDTFEVHQLPDKLHMINTKVMPPALTNPEAGLLDASV